MRKKDLLDKICILEDKVNQLQIDLIQGDCDHRWLYTDSDDFFQDYNFTCINCGSKIVKDGRGLTALEKAYIKSLGKLKYQDDDTYTDDEKGNR